jgi:hypothetical protein
MRTPLITMSLAAALLVTLCGTMAMADGASPPGDELDAVTQARFATAERARASADGVALAPYTGPAEGPSIRAYYRRVVAPWWTRRPRAVLEAEAAYSRVLGIPARVVQPLAQPYPCPPGAICLWPAEEPVHLESPEDPMDPVWKTDHRSGPWAVAILERIAALELATADGWESVPEMPGVSRCPPAVFCEPVDLPRDLALQRARLAVEACLRVSTEEAVVDEDSSSCERSSRRFWRPGPPIDEIRPRRGWLPATSLTWSPVGPRQAPPATRGRTR